MNIAELVGKLWIIHEPITGAKQQDQASVVG